MGIFNRHVHGKEGAPPEAIESVDTNMLPTDEIRSARVAQLSEQEEINKIAAENYQKDPSKFPKATYTPGVLRPRDAQIAQDRALEQVSGEHAALIDTGAAAEAAGHAAMMGAQEAAPVDVQHQLHG